MNISIVEMRISKLINHLLDMCWNGQGTMVYTFANCIYVWSKVVCFVCHTKSPKSQRFMPHSCYLNEQGCTTWLKTMVWKPLIIEAFFQGKLNKTETELYWNLGAFLVLLESPQQVRFNRVYFTIFRAKVWKILIF